MSSSVSTTTGGVVVVTHVHPTPQDGEPQRPVGIQKFVKGRPMILGTIQIIIGLMTLLFGIVMAINADTLGVFSGFFIWGALIYIAAGSLTVAAGKSLNRCQTLSKGVSGVLAAFHLLALIVSVTVAAFCCCAICNSGEQVSQPVTDEQFSLIVKLRTD
uniref:Uncharacterized protein n=1 Tax=Lates calcarifer TaxID=8187 RepID=A0A4W6D368_LATCA